MDLYLWMIVGVSFLFYPLCCSRPNFVQEESKSEINQKLLKAKLQRRFGYNPTYDMIRKRNLLKQEIEKRMETAVLPAPKSSEVDAYSNLEYSPLRSSNLYRLLSKLRQYQTSQKFTSKPIKKVYRSYSSSPRNDCVYWTSPEGTRHALNRLKRQHESFSDCRPKRSTFSRPYYSPGLSADLSEPIS